jgi:hypothetical protein
MGWEKWGNKELSKKIKAPAPFMGWEREGVNSFSYSFVICQAASTPQNRKI